MEALYRAIYLLCETVHCSVLSTRNLDQTHLSMAVQVDCMTVHTGMICKLVSVGRVSVLLGILYVQALSVLCTNTSIIPVYTCMHIQDVQKGTSTGAYRYSTRTCTSNVPVADRYGVDYLVYTGSNVPVSSYCIYPYAPLHFTVFFHRERRKFLF